jgi:putative redox protein
MVCGRGVPVQALGFGLWRSACSLCGDREANMSAVPEGITSADVIVWGEGGTFAQQIAAGRHRLKGDEPDSVGGTDTGPSPYDFLLAALGSCTSMTVGVYARKKNWPLERVTVWLRHSKVYAADCSECETREGMIDRIERDVRFEGPLSADRRSRLLEIANKCQVHRTLTSEINIRTRLL